MASTPLDPLPRYLFRAWTNVSNGTNDSSLFEPMMKEVVSPDTYKGMRFDADKGTLKSQLTTALYDKNAEHNPFIFTTVSLLYAVQHAIKKGKPTKNWPAGDDINIICIDTESARNSAGGKVQYRRVRDLCSDLGIKLSAKFTNQILDFSDVYITSDSIVPGQGSFVVSLDALKANGLFKLYPEWTLNYVLGQPGLEKPVSDLRKIWFHTEKSASPAEISLAAKLASSFEPVEDGEKSDTVPTHLFAWFLALRNPLLDGKPFKKWLQQNSEVMSDTGADADPNEHLTTRSGIAEVEKYTELMVALKQRKIRSDRVMKLDSTISYDRIRQLKASYDAERKDINGPKNEEQREKRKANRTENEALAAAKKLKMNGPTRVEGNN